MIAEFLIIFTMHQAERLPASDSSSESYREAARNAAQAYYIQSGMNKTVDERLQYYEKKVPKEVRKTLAWTAWGYRVVQDQKITYTWEF